MRKKVLVFFTVLLAAISVGFSTNSHQVNAAYGRGAKVTVPKAYRGTWYSYDFGVSPKKVRFTAHTMNGKTLYKQRGRSLARLYDTYLTASNRKQISIERAIRHWNSAQYSKFYGKRYFEVNPWLTFEKWRLFRPTTVKIRGKRVKILAFTSRYDGGNLYKSRSMARRMKNHKFRGIRYY